MGVLQVGKQPAFLHMMRFESGENKRIFTIAIKYQSAGIGSWKRKPSNLI
jgi:hypothetical protein